LAREDENGQERDTEKKQKGEQTKENEENESMIQVDIFIESVQKPTSS